ncbi:MAG: hypothetical protein ACFE91_08370 [Promethearchaeota archaeon]
MVEITKNLKILLEINAIIGLCFAFLYLAISQLYLSLIEWPFYDPYYSWAFGGTFLILSIFIILGIKQNNWEKIKTILQFLIALQLMILVLNIISLILIPSPIVSIITIWIYNITLILLVIANILFYNKHLQE